MDRSSIVRGDEHVGSSARWYARLSRPKIEGELTGAILRRFDGTDPTIEQPALDENIVAIHLGGARRVNLAEQVLAAAPRQGFPNHAPTSLRM